MPWGTATIFVCYAHSDNQSPDPKQRWLDRFFEFVRPIMRNDDVEAWSDQRIQPGEYWHDLIQDRVRRTQIAVLLISPAFLASDYIAKSEVPVLLKQARDRGMKILPILISPCLYEETRFKYPDWRTGPDELLLGSLQSINPPSRTLVEMDEGEQNRVLIMAARQLQSWRDEQVAAAVLEAEHFRQDRRDWVAAAALEGDRLQQERRDQVAAATLEAKRLRQERGKQEAKRIADLKAFIDENAASDNTRHQFSGRVCSLCGCSADAIAHFRWFQCEARTGG